jgi:NAD(P)-dependent dehydrogenase (short-subunit alcohol dehydrogenase family)
MPNTETKVAVVTGASQGIGAALVQGFRGRDYRVIAVSRSIKPSGDANVVSIQGDVADPKTADLVFKEAVDRFGRVDTLVNNAGMFMAKPFTVYSDDDYAAFIGTNVSGFFYMTRRAVDAMLKKGSGHVVTISTSLVDQPMTSVPAVLASLTKGTERRDEIACDRVRWKRRAGECGVSRNHQNAHASAGGTLGTGEAASDGPHGRDLGYCRRRDVSGIRSLRHRRSASR